MQYVSLIPLVGIPEIDDLSAAGMKPETQSADIMACERLQ